MCILFIAVNQHPNYPLIICAKSRRIFINARQGKCIGGQTMTSLNKYLQGKDLEAGGTWLGIKQNGQFSALT